MRNRYLPRRIIPQKALIALIISATLLLIAIIIVLVVKNGYLSIMLPLPFALLTFMWILCYIDETIRSKKKYEIKYDKVLFYEPLKKTREINIKSINEIFIVVHTIPLGHGVWATRPIRDVRNRNQLVYNVILLKSGCPTQIIKRNVSAFILQGDVVKEYVLYDFDYDSESVEFLLKQSKANIYTDNNMYSAMIQDPRFSDFLNRIKAIDFENW